MADETISTAILAVATIIAAVVLLNAVYPALYGAAAAMVSMNGVASDRMSTEIKVLTVWYGNRSEGLQDLRFWAKNTGSSTVSSAELQKAEVFLYVGDGTYTRVPYNETSGSSWSYAIVSGDGDANWDPGETLEAAVRYEGSYGPGTLRLRMALPDGIQDEYAFT